MGFAPVTTLDEPNYSFHRRTGRTSRQVDFAIQCLFSNQLVLVEDHYKNGNSIKSNQLLLDRIIRRIKGEYKQEIEIIKNTGLTILIRLL